MKTFEIQVTEQIGYLYQVEAESKEQAMAKYFNSEGVKEIRQDKIDEQLDYVEAV